MWLAIKIYIKVKRNAVEITNLETGETAQRTALNPFSSTRHVVSNFRYTEETIKAVLQDLNLTKKFFKRSFKVLIQQMEETEGGLSDIEIRALRDLAEQIGGVKVYVIDNDIPLSKEAAIDYLRQH